MDLVSRNLHRLMARLDLNVQQVVEQTGLDNRTITGLLSGRQEKPHAKTLHRLATGLGVAVDELFQNPSLLARRKFDRATNPAVEATVAAAPALFQGWTEAEFDELYSRFAAGGALTEEGTRRMVQAMNRNREVHQRVAVLLETHEAELLASLVNVLYERVKVDE